MNLKDISDMSLQLVNQFSVAGTAIPETYNNQADYLIRIPHLVNDCLTYISTCTLPQISTYSFVQKAEKGKDVRKIYDMPSNFYKPYGSSIPYINGRELPTYSYNWIGARRLAIDASVDGEINIDYYRYPYLFSSEYIPEQTEGGITTPWHYTDGDVEVDAPLEVQYAIPYYVASHLIMHDYQNQSYILMNEFELKMSRITSAPTVSIDGVEDVYGFSNFNNSIGGM